MSRMSHAYVSGTRQDPNLKRKALTAVAAKMTRVTYGIIKKNQPYRQFLAQSLPSGSIPLNRTVGVPKQVGDPLDLATVKITTEAS